jgi:hypothetical protein
MENNMPEHTANAPEEYPADELRFLPESLRNDPTLIVDYLERGRIIRKFDHYWFMENMMSKPWARFFQDAPTSAREDRLAKIAAFESVFGPRPVQRTSKDYAVVKAARTVWDHHLEAFQGLIDPVQIGLTDQDDYEGFKELMSFWEIKVGFIRIFNQDRTYTRNIGKFHDARYVIVHRHNYIAAVLDQMVELGLEIPRRHPQMANRINVKVRETQEEN